MQIRQENKSDWNSVYRVVREAFRKAEHSDGNEQELVTALRKSAAFVPELSLVAEENGSVVGYVLFTEARIGNRTGLALAPLAVLPDFQNKGIGAALVREGHRRAGELRYGCCVSATAAAWCWEANGITRGSVTFRRMCWASKRRTACRRKILWRSV